MRISDWSSDVCSSDLLGRDAAVDLLAPRGGAADEIVEKGHVGVDAAEFVDGGAQPEVMKFVEQHGDRGALHLMLVERLDGGEARGGAGPRAGRSEGGCGGKEWVRACRSRGLP